MVPATVGQGQFREDTSFVNVLGSWPATAVGAHIMGNPRGYFPVASQPDHRR
jgi:hypothetical protein